MFKDKTILITGGTGSLGKSLARHLLEKYDFKKLIIFSRDELKQFHMQREINDSRVRFFLGDVRDRERLEMAFDGVDIIIHTAALKQVPVLEYNPFEAVKTNVLGSQNVINAAIDKKVERVLLISTDKAAQPVNLYGSTKLCAEKLFVSGNSYSSGATKFSCVRYGNVIGSRGSVVETLLGNREAKKVQITDPDMTRFWITLSQAHDLVVFALENMAGGEIFIPKIPSLRLEKLFDTLAPQAEKEIIGIRPGEKLHEILLTEQEARHALELPRHYVILPEFLPQEQYNKFFKIGKKLSPDFRYTSDTNTEWLADEALRKSLAAK